MYIKLGFHQVRKNLMLSVFAAVQLAVVIYVVVSMCSIYSYHYEFYGNFAQYFNGQGLLCEYDGIVLDNVSLCEDTGLVEDALKKASVIGIYEAWLSYDGVSEADYETDEETSDMIYLCYDPELIAAYTPQLIQGEWLDADSRTDGEIIDAVVSSNAYGLQVGDVIELADGLEQQSDSKIKIRICGVLAEDSKIIGHVNGYELESNYEDLYGGITAETTPVVLLNIDDVNQAMSYYENNSIVRQLSDIMIVSYDDDITEQEQAYNEEVLRETIWWHDAILPMQEVRENSISDLKQKLIFLVPILICSIVFALLSAVCTNSIIVKEQLLNYAVYNMLGMGWKKCKYINMVHALCIVLCAALMAVLGCLLAGLSGLLQQTTLHFGLLEFAGCFVVSVLYVTIAVLVPNIFVLGKSVKDVMITQ